MKNKKIITVTIALVAVLMLAVSCTCQDNNYDKNDHAANVQRCLQSLEDGTAYEIDEALTAKAPWEVGAIVAKFNDGEGGFYMREFQGITKAGYYLVQDYHSNGPRYNPEKITVEVKATEPFAVMSRCGVTDHRSSPGTSTFKPSVCGSFTNYHAPELNEVFVQVNEQGLFLDGAKEGEWSARHSNGYIWCKETFADGLRINREYR